MSNKLTPDEIRRITEQKRKQHTVVFEDETKKSVVRLPKGVESLVRCLFRGDVSTQKRALELLRAKRKEEVDE